MAAKLRSREQRILARQAFTDDVVFGYDRFGTPIAESQGIVWVLWPRRPEPVSIADSIVVDGHDDTIAYIADAAGTIRGLLPRIDTPRSTGWTTGYGGGGPGDLISAICDTLTASGLTPDRSRIATVITSEHVPEQVTLNVRDIILPATA